MSIVDTVAWLAAYLGVMTSLAAAFLLLVKRAYPDDDGPTEAPKGAGQYSEYE